MKKKSTLIILCVIVVLCLGAMAIAVFFAQNKPIAMDDQVTPLPADALAAEDYQDAYPLQYESYLKNNLIDTEEGYADLDTSYGGAYLKKSHFDTQPYLPTLFSGMGFSVEYNEDRGHTYAVEDVKAITGERTKAGASCTYCKSSHVPSLLEKYGDDFYLQSFDDMISQMPDAITCADCHDPQTMELRITRPALVEAFERQGKDITQATNNEMRTLVCAQCHVEYYFEPETKIVTFPWDNGEKIENVYNYYEEIGFSDFTHGITGGSMLKMQHPDYELFLGSTHETNGVSCADCHMPYMVEGNVKYSSHWWTSPLKHVEQSCLQCHTGTAEDMKERVLYTQDRVWEIQDLAGQTLEKAVEDIKAAAESGEADETLLAEAKKLHRQGQAFWDWIAAENSRGFHNSQDALNTLGKAIDYGHKASEKARASY